MIKIIHPMAGVLALVTIASFWLSTAFSELFASHAVITAVKTAIPWGLAIADSGAGGGWRFGVCIGKGAPGRADRREGQTYAAYCCQRHPGSHPRCSVSRVQGASRRVRCHVLCGAGPRARRGGGELVAQASR
jgi:hypothetical protein